MNSLHLITVRETSDLEITATGATLEVEISGHSFITGSEAFKRAAEVASLVSALKELGLAEEKIKLLSVSTAVESGILAKTSSATYRISIDCESLDLLGQILTAVSSQKNSRLASITWKYPDLDRRQRELTRTAVHGAKTAARDVADALGVPLVGVHKLSYDTNRPDSNRVLGQMATFARAKAKARTEALDNLDLAHTGSISVTVTADFIVDTFVPENGN